MPWFLVVLAIQVLVVLHGVSCHLIWSFEERLILDFLHNLMYRISEHSVNYLRTGISELLCIVFPRSVVVVKLARLEVPPLLRDNLRFTFTQLLVLFNSFKLVDLVHELA